MAIIYTLQVTLPSDNEEYYNNITDIIEISFQRWEINGGFENRPIIRKLPVLTYRNFPNGYITYV